MALEKVSFMTLENGTKYLGQDPLHKHVKQIRDTKRWFLLPVGGMKDFQKASVGFTMAAHPAVEKAPVTINLGEIFLVVFFQWILCLAIKHLF